MWPFRKRQTTEIPGKIIDVVRVVYPNLLANHIAGIQPMNGNAASIFSFQFKHIPVGFSVQIGKHGMYTTYRYVSG